LVSIPYSFGSQALDMYASCSGKSWFIQTMLAEPQFFQRVVALDFLLEQSSYMRAGTTKPVGHCRSNIW
jgi:hypothetical protein